METGVVVGIDVAKLSLEVAAGDQLHFTVANHEEGIAQLVVKLQPLKPSLIVLEASGGYEKLAWLSLWEQGFMVARVNPRDTYHFAQANRQLAKTDRLDARGLRLFGEQIKPAPSVPLSAAGQELQDLVRRRQQLVSMITAESNRRQQASPAIRKSIGRIIRSLKREKDATEQRIAGELKQHHSKQVALLQSVPGVGPVTVAMLIARLPELGRLSAREAGALVGVVPYTRQSGKWHGESHIFGGRADLRSALYMAAHNAVRREGPLRDFYLRLRAAGKQHPRALTACIRKLVVILNAMVKHDTRWSPPCSTLA
jgi:transposase